MIIAKVDAEGLALTFTSRGMSREGLRGLEHPPSLPDFTKILPICLQLLFLTFTFVLMTQYIRLYLCSVKEKMKLRSICAAEVDYTVDPV